MAVDHQLIVHLVLTMSAILLVVEDPEKDPFFGEMVNGLRVQGISMSEDDLRAWCLHMWFNGMLGEDHHHPQPAQ